MKLHETTPRPRPAIAALILLALAGPARAGGADADWIAANAPGLLGLYKHLHAHPELSFHESATARRIAEELRKDGVEVTEGVGKTGLVGVLRNGDGPTVLVRTDLDALPVAESTGVPYASRVTTKDDAGNEVGVMHACGHDVHMTCLVGTARWLASHKDAWRGTVVLLGQPAEEKVAGAKAMLEDGLYEKFPKPDFALALHVAHDLETGKVAYCPGPAFAGSTEVDVVVRGKGGHGAMPNNTVDPIVLAALLVLDMQTIVSRELRPIDPAVVTVGSIHGGAKHNIIPDDVRLQLTIRAYSDAVRDQLIEGIERRAKGLAQAHRAPSPEVKAGLSTPPTINDPQLVAKVVPALKGLLGEENVPQVEPTMGAEDFGLYARDGVPAFMFRLGTVPPARMAEATAKGTPLPSLHSALYAPDPEPSIGTGIRAMTTAVVELLPPR